MKDNTRTAIGYICIASVFVSMYLGMAWIMSPTELTINLNADDNLLNITQTAKEMQQESKKEEIIASIQINSISKSKCKISFNFREPQFPSPYVGGVTYYYGEIDCPESLDYKMNDFGMIYYEELITDQDRLNYWKEKYYPLVEKGVKDGKQ